MAYSSILFLPFTPGWKEKSSDLLSVYLGGERLFLAVENREQLLHLARLFLPALSRLSFPYSLGQDSFSSFNLEIRLGSKENLGSLFPGAQWETSSADTTQPPGCSMDTLLYRAFYLTEHAGFPPDEALLLVPSPAILAQMKSRFKEIYRSYFSLSGDARFLELAATLGGISFVTPDEYFLSLVNQTSVHSFSFSRESRALFSWIWKETEALLPKYPHLLSRYQLSFSEFCRGLLSFVLSFCAQGLDLSHFTRTQLGACGDRELHSFLSTFLLHAAKKLPAIFQENYAFPRGLAVPFNLIKNRAFDFPRFLLVYLPESLALAVQNGLSLPVLPRKNSSAPCVSPVFLRGERQKPVAAAHLASLLPGSSAILTRTEAEAESFGAAFPDAVSSYTPHLGRTLPALDFAFWLSRLLLSPSQASSLCLPVLLSHFPLRSHTPFYLSRWKAVSAWLCKEIPYASASDTLAFLRSAARDPVGIAVAFSGSGPYLGTTSFFPQGSCDYVLLPYSPATPLKPLLRAVTHPDGEHIGYVFSPSRRKQLYSRFFTREDESRAQASWYQKTASLARKNAYLLLSKKDPSFSQLMAQK